METNKNTKFYVPIIVILIIVIFIFCYYFIIVRPKIEINNTSNQNVSEQNSINNILNEDLATNNDSDIFVDGIASNKSPITPGDNVIVNNNPTYEEITETNNPFIPFEDTGLSITSITKNGSNYTIKGVAYTAYTLTKSELEDIKNGRAVMLNNLEYKAIVKSIEDDYITLKPFNIPNDFDVANGTYDFTIRNDNGTYLLMANVQLGTVYRITDKYMQITLSKDITYIDEYSDEILYTMEELYNNFNYIESDKEERPHNLYTFKFVDSKCVEIYKVLTVL